MSPEEASRPCVILNNFFHGEDWLAPRPTPEAGGPPLVGSPRLLIRFIRSYPPYRRPFLHPQPKDAPCRGDRYPQTQSINFIHIKYGMELKLHKKLEVSFCATGNKWGVPRARCIYMYILTSHEGRCYF